MTKKKEKKLTLKDITDVCAFSTPEERAMFYKDDRPFSSSEDSTIYLDEKGKRFKPKGIIPTLVPTYYKEGQEGKEPVKVFCKNCRCYQQSEHYVFTVFTNPLTYKAYLALKQKREKIDIAFYGVREKSDRHCMHISCFEDGYKFDPITGGVNIGKRISGCMPKNMNYNCSDYKRKWWKIWL